MISSSSAAQNPAGAIPCAADVHPWGDYSPLLCVSLCLESSSLRAPVPIHGT